ncbi:ComEC/Rec2 family competence protein, partial [Patescibacteria group bacterium]
IEVRAGDSFPLCGELRLDVLWPVADAHRLLTEKADRANELSVVSRVMTLGPDGWEPAALLTGDIGAETETLLVESGADLTARVLKVPHHGSRYSSTAALISAVGAATAVVQVGENRFGHPSAATLLRHEYAGATVRRNDRDGTVRLPLLK